MSEKRGYPNPNYTEGDILESIPMEVKTELILDEQLVEYIQKAAMFDCLATAIRLTGHVDDDVVKAITGTVAKEEMVPKKDADNYWRYYMREQDKTKELQEKVATLERARADLIEILRQNKIGEFADEAKEDQEEAPSDE
jgi:hypothetical protein